MNRLGRIGACVLAMAVLCVALLPRVAHRRTPPGTTTGVPAATVPTSTVGGEGVATIYLAGGCFWGVEKYMASVNGVINAEVGYANGTTDSPTYGDVSTGRTRLRRDGARRLRPHRGAAPVPARALLQGHRPDLGQPAGQRRGHAVPQRHLLHRPRGPRRHRALAREAPEAATTSRSPSRPKPSRATPPPRSTTRTTSTRTRRVLPHQPGPVRGGGRRDAGPSQFPTPPDAAP